MIIVISVVSLVVHYCVVIGRFRGFVVDDGDDGDDCRIVEDWREGKREREKRWERRQLYIWPQAKDAYLQAKARLVCQGGLGGTRLWQGSNKALYAVPTPELVTQVTCLNLCLIGAGMPAPRDGVPNG